MRRHLQQQHPSLLEQLLGPAAASPEPESSRMESGLSSSSSWAWHFLLQEEGEGDSCRFCNKRLGVDDTAEIAAHLEEQHWAEVSRICLTCLEPADGDGVVTCPDCGCRRHTGCISEQQQDLPFWCLFCRCRGKSKKPRTSQAEAEGDRGKKTVTEGGGGGGGASLCPHCGKEFRYLAQHIKLAHLGLVKYAPAQCDICKKVYTQKSHLKQHVRAVHEQVKDHKCNFCGRAFFRKMHFKRHMQSMHMDIHVYQHVTCSACGKQFKSRTALYKHNRVVHLGIKPTRSLFCEECGQTFTQSGSLYSHMRKMHEKEPDIPKNRTNFFKDKVLVDTERILECHPELRQDILSREEACSSV